MKKPLLSIAAVVCLAASSLFCPAQDAASPPASGTNAPVGAPPAATPESTNAPAAPQAAPAIAPPPAATNAPSIAVSENGRSIRFQFDGIPYMDVVERFAQMVNKPLIADTRVEGTVTFSDPKPYNYSEALDALNLILSMKEVMLVESDRYLRLIPLKKLAQMPLKFLRGVDQSGDVRPGEIVTVVMKLQNIDPGEISQSITPMLSNAGSVAPASRGRGLIITDRMETIKRIANLLANVDIAGPAERTMKTLTILNASGPVLSDLINRTFGVATAPTRSTFNQERKRYESLPASPEDYVTAIWDETSRTMVLFGPTERVSMAEDLIKRFDGKEGARASEVKIFYPKTVNAEDLAKMVRQAVPGIAAP
jgi:type II secretory pathway component GspD/PulD (secretin)